MRLFIVFASLICLLAISNRHAHGAAVIGYPYRTELLAYRPARGEFPVVNSLAQGYVRYLDHQGVQHVIGYKYPDPIQSRRITNEEYLKQLIKASINKDEAESSKEREEHFRLWSVNQYEQYRQEIERLKAAGQEPSTDLLGKTKIFEDIVIATRRGSSNDETPQLKQVRDEHLKAWNAGREAANAEMQNSTATKHLSAGGLETTGVRKPDISLRFQSVAEVTKDVAPVSAPAQVVIVGETSEQQKAREEHLRIYKEQLQRVQQAQAEAAKANSYNLHQIKDARAENEAHQVVGQQQHEEQGVHSIQNFNFIHETPEVQRAKAEHLRLWNEAKLRAEKEKEDKVNTYEHRHQSEEHIETKNIAYKPDQIAYEGQEKQTQHNFVHADRAQQQQHLRDTADTVSVVSAEQSSEKYQDKLYGQRNQHHHISTSFEQKTENNPQLPTPVQDTPEVQRARAEHLKILEELQKKATYNMETQKSSKIATDSAMEQQTFMQPERQQQQYIHTTATTMNQQLGSIATKTISDIVHQQQMYATVQNTAEVQRAREDHLKLLKEAHMKASQYQTESAPNTYAAPIIEKITDELKSKESEEEARLRAEEAKQREAEHFAEEARLKDEQRILAEEQQRLQMEEQKRLEKERLEQARLEKEYLEQRNEKKKHDENNDERSQLPLLEQTKQTSDLLKVKPIQTHHTELAISSDGSQHHSADNANLLRFASAGTPVATTAYYIGTPQQPAQQQQQQLQKYDNRGYYYLGDVDDGYLKVDKPYFVQFVPNQQIGKEVFANVNAVPLSSALTALNQAQKLEQPIATTFADKPSTQIIPIGPDAIGAPLASAAAAPYIPISSPITPSAAQFSPLNASIAPLRASIAPGAPIVPIASFAPSSAAMNIAYGSDPALVALDKATREHFRAHEIALEQLRLANDKPVIKDCY